MSHDHRKPYPQLGSALPLEGGGLGGGARAYIDAEGAGGAARVLPQMSSAHPHPCPSPFEGEGSVRSYLADRARLIEANAYDPASERDACGVGFVCAIDGKPRREVVRAGHRGAEGGVGTGARWTPTARPATARA